MTFPSWVLSSWTVRAFNALIFKKQGRKVRRGIVHPEAFFYPLDAVLHWNRIYGRRGFTQYQCVLPFSDDGSSYRRFFDLLVQCLIERLPTGVHARRVEQQDLGVLPGQDAENPAACSLGLR